PARDAGERLGDIGHDGPELRGDLVVAEQLAQPAARIVERFQWLAEDAVNRSVLEHVAIHLRLAAVRRTGAGAAPSSGVWSSFCLTPIRRVNEKAALLLHGPAFPPRLRQLAVQVMGLELLEDDAGPLQHLARRPSEAGDVDAVALAGAAGGDLVQEDDVLLVF